MKKLIVVLFMFASLTTSAQVELSSADKVLLEQEVRLICTQDKVYFESIIKDKVEETGTYGNIPCVLKTNPFAKIPLTAGFTYKCFYNYGAKTASYEIEVGGKGKTWEDFNYALFIILKKLTKEGVFEYHVSNKENYCLIRNDGIPIDAEQGMFSFEHYQASAPFRIFSQQFKSQGSANNTLPISTLPAVIMTPELEEKFKANMEAGDKAIAQSDYPTAIAKFDSACAIKTKDANSQLMLGLAHLEYAEKLLSDKNSKGYKLHDDLGRYAIILANIRNPENPVIMYYNWKYLTKPTLDKSIALLNSIIEKTNSNFREPVYSRCKIRLLAAISLRQEIDKDVHSASILYKDIAGTDEKVSKYKSLVNAAFGDFQFILKNYAAEPLDIYQYAGRLYLMEYNIDSAVYCLQKVKDNAAKIKWIDVYLDQYYETARINKIRLQHTSLADVIKSDNLFRNNSFTAAIATDKFNAMAYVKRAEANQQKDLKLGVEYLKENAAIHRLILSDYESARNIYPDILRGKTNEVIAFFNKWIYEEEHFNELNDLSKRTTASNTPSDNYRAVTDLYNSANTPSTRYETLLNCSYCRGTGEVYNPNGGFSTNTSYYLLGGSGLIYQGKANNSTYIKCNKCNGSGKVRY